MFYVQEDASLWAHWIHSFHMHLTYLGPILFPCSPCFLHSPSLLAITVGVAASAESHLGFPDGSDGKESTCNAGYLGSIPGLGRSPGGGHGSPLQFLAWRIHGQRTLAGDSPWGRKESDTTEWLSTAQYIHIWRPEVPDSWDSSCLLIWQEIFSFHKA